MSIKRSIVWVFIVCTSALALAAAARFYLIEPADMRHLCDGGASEARCLIRAWIIQSFVHERIGWVALTIACIATLTQWRSFATAALFLACAGLILYTTELCALAALLSVMVLTRQGHASDQDIVNNRKA